MDVALGDVARHHADDEGLREVDAEDLGVVVRVAMQRLGLDVDVIHSGDGHALLEVLDVSIAALARVRVRLLVEIEVAIVEHVLVRPAQLLVLHEVAVEAPLLGLHRRFAQTCLDQAIGRLEVLIHEEAGGHQCLANRVDVMTGLLLREIRRQAQRVHASAKQSRQRSLILTAGETAHHGATAGALELASGGQRAIAQRTNHRQTFVITRLIRLLWRHLLQRELVDDVLRLNEFSLRLQRQLKGLILAVALLHRRVMTLQAVFAEELLHELGCLISGLRQSASQDRKREA